MFDLLVDYKYNENTSTSDSTSTDTKILKLHGAKKAPAFKANVTTGTEEQTGATALKI